MRGLKARAELDLLAFVDDKAGERQEGNQNPLHQKRIMGREGKARITQETTLGASLKQTCMCGLNSMHMPTQTFAPKCPFICQY